MSAARASPRRPARGWPRPSATASTRRSTGRRPLLDAEARRVDAVAGAAPLHAMPIALKDNIVTTDAPDHLRLAHPRGLRLALRRHRGRAGSARPAR